MKPECFKSGVVEISDSCDGENYYVWSIQDRFNAQVYDHIMTEMGSYMLMPGSLLEKSEIDKEIDNALNLEIDPIAKACKHNFGFTSSDMHIYVLTHHWSDSLSTYLFQCENEVKILSTGCVDLETIESLVDLLDIDFAPDDDEYITIEEVSLKDIPLLVLNSKKAEKDSYYLIYLQGQGDTQATILDQESWDWITNNDVHAIIPESIKKRYIEINADMYPEGKEDLDLLADLEDLLPCETSGSFKNDRALAVPGIFFKDYEARMYGGALEIIDMIAFWKKQLGIKEFTDTFEGQIY